MVWEKKHFEWGKSQVEQAESKLAPNSFFPFSCKLADLNSIATSDHAGWALLPKLVTSENDLPH